MQLLLVFALVVTAASATDNWRYHTVEETTKYDQDCAKELEISNELFEKYKKYEYPDDEATHCFIRCVHKKMQLFTDETGHIANNVVRQLSQSYGDVDVEIIRTEVKKCIDPNPIDDKCKWAYKGFICFQNSNPELVKDPE
uniref:Proteinral odorant-binding protein 99a obp n=1 Tax=Corethrella appendiculata TaxID=1370023 RepID=U5EK30_9DIPT